MSSREDLIENASVTSGTGRGDEAAGRMPQKSQYSTHDPQSAQVNGQTVGLQTPEVSHLERPSRGLEDGGQQQEQHQHWETGSQASQRRSEISQPPPRMMLHTSPAADEPFSGPAANVTVRARAAEGTETRARDLGDAFVGVPRVRPQWVDRYMKVMVVGEAGMGKTTFIKNLFASYAQDPDLRVNDVPGPTSLDTFQQNPDKLQTEIVVRDEKTQIAYHYTVQDTPGYDNLEVTIDPVLHHITEQNILALEREQDSKRPGPMAKLQDPRVDVAVYFIAPHRLKPVDIEFIKRLSAEVPVLPVLAKADAMTSDELSAFRSLVQETLYTSGEQGAFISTTKAGKGKDKPLAHKFSREALIQAGATHEVPPFAVVASNDYDLSVGRLWPVRRYPWGSCESLSSRHSDLAALKRLLFEVSFWELKEATEARYYAFREKQLKELEQGSKRTIIASPEQLQRHQPTRGQAVLGFLGTAARWALQGAVVYVAVSLLAGRDGKQRLEQDLHVLQEKSQVVQEKAGEAGSVAASAAGQARDKAQELGGTAKEKAQDVKRTVQIKFESAEEQAERVKREQEQQNSRRRGPFGLFKHN